MKEPYWFAREECLMLHELMLAQYGGAEGLREEHLLESALARPRQLFALGQPSMAELAASYVAGVIQDHPFLDGNKRTGFLLGAGFLERHGFVLTAPEVEVVLHTLALAAGEMTEAAYAEWLQANAKRRPRRV